MESCNHVRNHKFGKTRCGEQRFRCRDCGKTYVDSTRTLNGMTIGVDRAEHVLRCMMEGVGVRGTARLTGLAINTVMDVLVLIGERCRLFLDDTLVNVPVKDVEADEIWSFVFCKDKTRKKLSLPVSTYGDKYCFVALERHNKLALAWHLGARDFYDGRRFIIKLARACGNHDFQITTDGWRNYRELIPDYLRNASFAMLIKVFANRQNVERYSPGQIIEIKRKAITGEPEPDRVCTSFVERHNLSMRTCLRRMTRLTNGFSRKLENHRAALGAYFAAYNFITRHSTLRTTPAVAAGIASEPWTIGELIERTATYSPPKPKTAFEQFIDSLPDE